MREGIKKVKGGRYHGFVSRHTKRKSVTEKQFCSVEMRSVFIVVVIFDCCGVLGFFIWIFCFVSGFFFGWVCFVMRFLFGLSSIFVVGWVFKNFFVNYQSCTA